MKYIKYHSTVQFPGPVVEDQVGENLIIERVVLSPAPFTVWKIAQDKVPAEYFAGVITDEHESAFDSWIADSGYQPSQLQELTEEEFRNLKGWINLAGAPLEAHKEGILEQHNQAIKNAVRALIKQQVGDIEDRIADSFKWHYIVLHALLEIFKGLSDSQRGIMEKEIRDLLDYIEAIKMESRMDFADNLFDEVQKLIDREEKVKEIMGPAYFEKIL